MALHVAWPFLSSLVLVNVRTRNLLAAALSAAHADCRQELLTGFRLVSKCADHPAGDHVDVMLTHSARGHAPVNALDHHGNTTRFQRLIQCASDLSCHSLLNLEPFRVDFN